MHNPSSDFSSVREVLQGCWKVAAGKEDGSDGVGRDAHTQEHAVVGGQEFPGICRVAYESLRFVGVEDREVAHPLQWLAESANQFCKN